MVGGLSLVSALDARRALEGHPGSLEPCEARTRQAPDDRQHRDQGPPSCGRRKRGTSKGALGRSRRSFSTKIHMRVNGADLQMRTEIAPRQDSGYTGYGLFIADNLPQPSVLLADRGHDSAKVREDLGSHNAVPMIPMRKNSKVRKTVDMAIYTLPTLVERRVSKLKNSTRLVNHYDKTADIFLGFVDIACTRLWLLHSSTRPSDRCISAVVAFSMILVYKRFTIGPDERLLSGS
ncbi:putative transposase [Ketogulonicigenium vulgare WSH-001]|uniref:Putative transposase n=1 Tax=Ketogulonicigenium vulgare (strain WSH-001) TaxID=759362 RepID=F9Y8T2_KETVW|nr:putative transposase [Ketogulonicigenium vulgare WSH-001]